MSTATERLAAPVTEPSRSLHLLVDGWSAVPERLDDGVLVRAAILSAVESIGATLIGYSAHRFSSHGITAVALLAESHLAVHTWPERAYFAADLFFCGADDPEGAMRSLAKSLGAADLQIRRVQRGPARPTERADA